MTTGAFENWAVDVSTLGPLYPFVGWEGLMTFVGVALWIAWHVWQISSESNEWENDLQKFGGKPLPKEEYHE